MYTVLRRYSGSGAAELMSALEQNKPAIESLIRGVAGFVSYTLLRTPDGGISITTCQDKAGTDESIRVAGDWVRQNTSTGAAAPQVTEGEVILHM